MAKFGVPISAVLGCYDLSNGKHKQKELLLDYVPLKMKAVQSFDTSVTVGLSTPKTQCAQCVRTQNCEVSNSNGGVHERNFFRSDIRFWRRNDFLNF